MPGMAPPDTEGDESGDVAGLEDGDDAGLEDGSRSVEEADDRQELSTKMAQ